MMAGALSFAAGGIMAKARRKQGMSDQELITTHIDLDYERYPGGRADARLRSSGVSVWAIVAMSRIYSGDLARTAEHFELSRDEMDGAMAYYRANKAYVDARVLLNQA
jgi:hypothetical protein